MSHQGDVQHHAERVRGLAGLDPAMLLLIIQAILAVLGMIRECREWNEEWRPSRYRRFPQFMVRNMVRRKLQARIGHAAYEQLGGMEFVETLIEYSGSVTDDEIIALADALPVQPGQRPDDPGEGASS